MGTVRWVWLNTLPDVEVVALDPIRQRVLIEIEEDSLEGVVEALDSEGFDLDRSFKPVPMEGGTVILRGKVESSQLERLRHVAGVRSVSSDAPIAPF